jgi:lipopolysaccharide biosynthesis glycosyltransferase
MNAPACDFAIALCADHKYFPIAYAMCQQLADRREQYDIVLLTEPGPYLARVPSGNDPSFRILTPQFVDRLPRIPEMYRAVPQFAYLRLFLPGILKDYCRVLYLDCDVRADGDVAPLFKLDMKGFAMAAVDGVGTYTPTLIKSRENDTDQARMGKLGFDPAAPYFNSGVLLLDCERWRRERLTDAAIDIAHQFGAALKSCDQDVLNILFHKKWLPLSPLWNFGSHLFQTNVEQVLKPILLHSSEKPWRFGESIRRERIHFERAIKNTPVADLMARPTFHDIRHIATKRAKVALQYATFFLPSSYQRIMSRSRKRSMEATIHYILENIRLRRFADVEQNLSFIDAAALARLLH